MALPGPDAGVWLSAAPRPAQPSLFYQTGPVGAAETISQIAALFVAGRLDSPLRSTSPERSSRAARSTHCVRSGQTPTARDLTETRLSTLHGLCNPRSIVSPLTS